MKRHRQRDWARLITGIVFFVAFFSFSIVSYNKIKQNNSTNIAEPISTTITEKVSVVTPPATETKTEQISTPVELPKNIHLTVPFTSQAPFANWDALHEDACEEASLIIVKHFKDKTPIGDQQSVDNQINDLVSYENGASFGASIALADLAKIAKVKFNMTGTVKAATLENLKTELAAGNPIIVGAAGKILPNPNFRNGGPNYHMLVIIGYNTTEFITNDPGTRNGKDFVYKYDDLLNAIHDWDPNNILNGKKNYLVF